jgi:hypothetical protein
MRKNVKKQLQTQHNVPIMQPHCYLLGKPTTTHMRSVKTDKITIVDLPPSSTLESIFDQTKKELTQSRKTPVRIVLLDYKNNQADFLVSYLYEKNG